MNALSTGITIPFWGGPLHGTTMDFPDGPLQIFHHVDTSPAPLTLKELYESISEPRETSVYLYLRTHSGQGCYLLDSLFQELLQEHPPGEILALIFTMAAKSTPAPAPSPKPPTSNGWPS